MQRTCKPICLIFLALALSSAASAQSINVEPDIPAELSYVRDFVRFLQKAGLVVQKVQRSHLESEFKDVTKAAFITTNKGVVEVVFFPGITDAEKIRVTQYDLYTSEPVVPHKYKIEGQPINGDGGPIHATHPLYFTTYKNWFIETTKCELDALIKGALSQRQ